MPYPPGSGGAQLARRLRLAGRPRQRYGELPRRSLRTSSTHPMKASRAGSSERGFNDLEGALCPSPRDDDVAGEVDSERALRKEGHEPSLPEGAIGSTEGSTRGRPGPLGRRPPRPGYEVTPDRAEGGTSPRPCDEERRAHRGPGEVSGRGVVSAPPRTGHVVAEFEVPGSNFRTVHKTRRDRPLERYLARRVSPRRPRSPLGGRSVAAVRVAATQARTNGW